MNFSKKKQLSKMQDGLQESGAVTSFDFSQFRERDWQNVVSCNESGQQHMWSYANHSISKISI